MLPSTAGKSPYPVGHVNKKNKSLIWSDKVGKNRLGPNCVGTRQLSVDVSCMNVVYKHMTVISVCTNKSTYIGSSDTCCKVRIDRDKKCVSVVDLAQSVYVWFNETTFMSVTNS